jgi:hypothetical protein
MMDVGKPEGESAQAQYQAPLFPASLPCSFKMKATQTSKNI